MKKIKKIKLTNGYFSLIDEEDFERVSKHSWCSAKTFNQVRAFASINCQQVRLHRFIMNLQKGDGFNIDHINGNTLDNRKCNLRICTKQQNQCNMRKRKNCSSKYKGVSWTGSKWYSYINVNNKRINLGYFEDELEAAKSYNEAAKIYHKIFAKLNQI